MAGKPTHEELKQRIRELEEDSAKRKRAEAQLTQALKDADLEREKLRTVVNSATFGMVLIGKGGTFIHMNPKFKALFGYDEADVPNGKEWFRRAFPDAEYRQAVIATWIVDQESAKPGERRPRVFQVTCKDGSIKTASIATVLLEKGENLVSFEDISERKRAEESLREAEERYRDLYDEAPVGYHQIDSQGRITEVNRQETLMLGYSAEEMIGQPIWNFIVDKEAHEAREMIRAKLAGLNPPSKGLERNYKRKDGTYISVLLDDRFLTDDDGRIMEIRTTIRDNTERKRAEEALRTLSSRQQALLDAIPDIIMEVNADKVYTWANPAGLDFFGEDVIGQEAALYFEGDQETYEVVQPLFKGDENVIYLESWQRRKDGEKRLLAWWCRVLKDEQGNVTGALSSARDITDRKRAEEEREKLQAQLLQAQKMESVGRLAGGVAHDFNNKLGVILGCTELALRNVDPEDSSYPFLRDIGKAGQQSAVLVRQLLAFARKQTVSPTVQDLNDTVSGMLKMLQRLIGEDIELAWMPGHDLWPVKVDPSQIDQILANLAVNARDAIVGVGKMTIETANATLDETYCSAHPGFVPGQYVLLAVSDDGVGMSKDILEHLFEPFFTTKEVGKGTGLGLATIYGIVKQNNGFISVDSEPGKGSTFKTYVPRFEATAVEMRVEKTPEPLQGGTETVLMVEDEAAILTIGKAMLEELGYRVLSANNPGDAIRLAREQGKRVQLLLTDVVMPGMNGRDLADQLKAVCPRFKCLYMSGYTANVIAHHGVLDDGVIFIQKPFSMKDLATKVREALDK